jgi:uncharacterized repeat protein (TIGR04076 family)
MLGLLYGAHFQFTPEGDCNVCCPAVDGVDVIVRKRPNDGSFDKRIPSIICFIIFAEVVKAHSGCSYGHKAGQRFVFPTCMKSHFMCPAAFNNIFPLLLKDPPACIDRARVRCPDWATPILFKAPEEKHGPAV